MKGSGCLVTFGASILPWAALVSAWWLSGQWWLGVVAMLAGGFLDIKVLGAVDRWMTDHGK